MQQKGLWYKTELGSLGKKNKELPPSFTQLLWCRVTGAKKERLFKPTKLPVYFILPPENSYIHN